MKAKFLKIAGVKTEKEFYDKYPTEEAFMAKCGAKLRKAYPGIKLPKAQGGVDMNIFGELGQAGPKSWEKGENPMFRENLGQTIGQVGGIIDAGIQGIQAINAEKEKLRQFKQMGQVTDAALMAKQSDVSHLEVADQRQRMQVNPWDNVITPEHRMPQGVGTNVLAKHGSNLKKYQGGGNFMKFMNAGGQGVIDQGLDAWTGNSGGSQVGEAVGNAVSMIPGVGPVVGAVAKPVLKAIGHLALSAGTQNKMNQAQNKIDNNVNRISGMNFGNFMQNKNKGFMKNGGVIYDQGGSLNGDVQTTFGGKTETLSYNPYAPDNGETSILKGAYHKEGGIGMQYGGNMVEAEHDEPIVKNDDNSISIMGRLTLPKDFKKAAESTLGEKLSGNKFNTFVKSVGEKEEEQNKIIKTSIEDADKYSHVKPLDRISLNTLNLNIEQVAKPKLKKLQEVKDSARLVQDSINETAEELNLKPEELSQGKIKKTRRINKKSKAQGGKHIFKTEEEAEAAGFYIDPEQGGQYVKEVAPGIEASEIVIPGVKGKAGKEAISGSKGVGYKQRWNQIKNTKIGERFKDYEDFVTQAQAYNEKTGHTTTTASVAAIPGTPGTPDEIIKQEALDPIYEYATIQGDSTLEKKKKKFPWMGMLNQLPQMFQKSDAEPFDSRQLIPELFAMSNNQLEAVDAQKFSPRLNLPYDISYQEALNRNRASARSAEKLAAYNPGMLANLKAQEYAGNQSVLAEQFRANQAKKDAVYSGNVNMLNEADKLNLQIMDQQYQRQAMAKSNTKAIAQSALSSISDKLAKHSLENATLRIWENMYNYRFDPNYKARYQGPAADFTTWAKTSGLGGGVNPKDFEPRYNERGEVVDWVKRKTSDPTKLEKAGKPPNFVGKNGMLVRKLKKYK
jgi:hypothetical protein